MHPGVSDPKSFVLNREALEGLNGSSCLLWSRVFNKSISKWVVSSRISNYLGREHLQKMTKHFKWEKDRGLQWGSKHRTFRSQNLSWPLKWSRGQFSLKVANPQYLQIKLLFGLKEIKPVVPLHDWNCRWEPYCQMACIRMERGVRTLLLEWGAHYPHSTNWILDKSVIQPDPLHCYSDTHCGSTINQGCSVPKLLLYDHPM